MGWGRGRERTSCVLLVVHEEKLEFLDVADNELQSEVAQSGVTRIAAIRPIKMLDVLPARVRTGIARSFPHNTDGPTSSPRPGVPDTLSGAEHQGLYTLVKMRIRVCLP